MEAGIEALARLLNLRDGYTGLHAERASTLAGAVGDRLGMKDGERTALQSAARLHDIGKVGIPDRILHKPDRLDPDEWAVMRCHPGLGRRGARRHAGHGGRGHDRPLAPRALGRARVPRRAGRARTSRWRAAIIGACEAFCSLTADRPFRPALTAGSRAAGARGRRGDALRPGTSSRR